MFPSTSDLSSQARVLSAPKIPKRPGKSKAMQSVVIDSLEIPTRERKTSNKGRQQESKRKNMLKEGKKEGRKERTKKTKNRKRKKEPTKKQRKKQKNNWKPRVFPTERRPSEAQQAEAPVDAAGGVVGPEVHHEGRRHAVDEVHLTRF